MMLEVRTGCGLFLFLVLVLSRMCVCGTTQSKHISHVSRHKLLRDKDELREANSFSRET